MSELLPWILLCFWLFGFWFLWRIPTPEDRRNAMPAQKTLSIIVPARNEENNIGRLLDSLEKQSFAPLEVIVVDDQSEDRTGEIAAAFGCRVLPSGDVPQGWAGKPWACMQGALASRGDLLLFLDADTFLAEGGLEKILGSLPERGIVSVQPYHFMQRAYERLSAVFNIIVLGGSNAFTPLGQRLKPVGAFGPCLLCAREDYLAVGGHERVRADILENVALGRAFLEEGFRVFCYGGKGVLFFRMYGEGFRAMVEGFTKSFGVGANVISWTELVMIVCWVFGSVSTTRHFILSITPLNIFDFYFWFAFYCLYVVQLHWMLIRVGNFGLWPAFLFPVPILFFILVFFVSLFKSAFLKKAHWKGRTVSTRQGDRTDS